MAGIQTWDDFLKNGAPRSAPQQEQKPSSGNMPLPPASPQGGLKIQPWDDFIKASPPNVVNSPGQMQVKQGQNAGVVPEPGKQQETSDEGFWSLTARSFGQGAMQAGREATAGAAAAIPSAVGGSTVAQQAAALPEPAVNDEITRLSQQPISVGYTNPRWWGVKIGAGLGASAPTATLGAAGAVGGGMLAGPPGAVAGAALGGGGGMALQTIVPAYKAAKLRGLSDDDAMDEALIQTGIAGSFGAAMGIVGPTAITGRTITGALRRPVTEALTKMGLIEPGLMVAQQQAQKAAGPGGWLTPDDALEGYITGVGIGAVMHGAGVVGTKAWNTAAGAAGYPISPDLLKKTWEATQGPQPDLGNNAGAHLWPDGTDFYDKTVAAISKHGASELEPHEWQKVMDGAHAYAKNVELPFYLADNNGKVGKQDLIDYIESKGTRVTSVLNPMINGKTLELHEPNTNPAHYGVNPFAAIPVTMGTDITGKLTLGIHRVLFNQTGKGLAQKGDIYAIAAQQAMEYAERNRVERVTWAKDNTADGQKFEAALLKLAKKVGAPDGQTLYSNWVGQTKYVDIVPVVGSNIRAGVSLFSRGPGTTVNEDPFRKGREAINQAFDLFEMADKRKMPSSTWVQTPEGGSGIYLRLKREGEKRLVDVANLDFERRGTGAFSHYLDHIESESQRRGWHGVRVENILNDRLPGFLERRGYVKEQDPFGFAEVPSYRKEHGQAPGDASASAVPSASSSASPDARMQDINTRLEGIKQEIRREIGTGYDRQIQELFQGQRTVHSLWELSYLGTQPTQRPASREIPQRLKRLLDQVKFLGEEARRTNEEMGGRTYNAAHRPGHPFAPPSIAQLGAADLMAAGRRIGKVIEALRRAMGMRIPITIDLHDVASPRNIYGLTTREPTGYKIDLWLPPHTDSGAEGLFSTAAHEFGHVVMFHFFDRAPIAVKNGIADAFNVFRQSLPPGASMNQLGLLRHTAIENFYGSLWYEPDIPLLSLTPERQRYWAGFEEWFAEQVSRWAASSVKPQTITEKFFASLNRRILETLQKFQAKLPLERAISNIDVTNTGAILPSDQMKKWLDSLLKDAAPFAADIFAAAQLRSLRQNQVAFDMAGEPGVNAVAQTSSTGAGRGLLSRLFGRAIPNPQIPAGADIFNRFYKYMISLPQLAKLNPHIDGLQRYRELSSMLHLEKNSMTGEAETTLHLWRALLPRQADAVGGLINDYMNMTYRTPQEVTQKVRRNPTEPEFQQLIHSNRVNDKGLEVFKNVVQDFDRMLERYKMILQQDAHGISDPVISAQKLQDIDQQIVDLRKGPYFPAMRFGNYTLTVRDSADKVVHFETFESQRYQKLAHEEALRQFPGHNVRSGFMAKDVAPMVGLPPGLIDKIGEKLSLSPTQQAALEELRYEYTPAQSFAHRFQQKKMIPGYSEDFLRAYANYMFHGANYFTRIKYIDQLNAALKSIRTESLGIEYATKRDQIANYVGDHLRMMMNPRTDFATLRSLIFHWALGASPAAATLNLSQTILGTYPYLASKFGSDTRAIGAMANASRKLSTFYTKGGIEAATDPDMKGLAEAVKQGLISETQANTLAATADGRVLLKGFGGNRAEKAFNTFSRMSQFFFEMTEQTNRRVAFRAAWDMALADPGNRHVAQMINENKILYESLRLKGFTQQEAGAFVTAKDAVESTQYVYAPYARPRFMQGPLMSTVFLFHSFTQNTLFYLWNNPGAAARSLIILGAAGGLMGLPGMEDMNGILRALAYHLFGKDFDLQDQVRQFVVDVMNGGGHVERPGNIMGDSGIRPDILLHGLSRVGYGIPAVMDMLGSIGGMGHVPMPVVDRHNNLSMGNILPFQPGQLLAPQITGPGAGGQNLDSAALGQVQRSSGAVFGLGFALYKFLESIQQGGAQEIKKWETVMPTAMRNASQAFRFYQQGKARNAQDAAVVRFDPSEPEQMMEIIAQGLGYRPERLSAAWDRITAEREAEAFWDLRKQYLMKSAFHARQSGDADAWKSAQEAIRKYNKDLPEEARGKAITGDALRASFEQRAKANALTEAGVPKQRGNVPLARSVQRLYPEAAPDAGRRYPPQGGALGK